MDLNLNNVTFIIVTYNSEQVINNCLDSLPKEASKIIIENSNNIETKNYLEKKESIQPFYTNIADISGFYNQIEEKQKTFRLQSRLTLVKVLKNQYKEVNISEKTSRIFCLHEKQHCGIKHIYCLF